VTDLTLLHLVTSIIAGAICLRNLIHAIPVWRFLRSQIPQNGRLVTVQAMLTMEVCHLSIVGLIILWDVERFTVGAMPRFASEVVLTFIAILILVMSVTSADMRRQIRKTP